VATFQALTAFRLLLIGDMVTMLSKHESNVQ
jgi:hypothetical protein